MPKTRKFKELFDKMPPGKKKAVREKISGALEERDTSNRKIKLSSLRHAIFYGLACERGVVVTELVGRLLSEPGVELEDLDQITTALNSLLRDNLLEANFRTNVQELNIEVVFRSAPRRSNPI